MNTKNNYYLLLIDIVNSTQMANKPLSIKIKNLEKQLAQFNKQHKKKIALPLSLNYGDEIAGLFIKPEPIYQIVSQIRQNFYPLTEIRFAVVKGQIGIVSNDIRKIGGPIFKKANEAITLLKQKNLFCTWDLGNINTSQSLNALCELTNLILQDMSHYQRQVYELYNQSLSQKQIAHKLKKQAQSVWDAIQRSKANPVLNSEKIINQILQDYE